MLIAIIAGLETMFLAAARSKQGRARRQQLLMGAGTDHSAVPIVDNYLKQKTASATRFQRFIASKLAALCRRVVHTRSFEYVLLHVVRTAILKHRNKLLNMKRRIVL